MNQTNLAYTLNAVAPAVPAWDYITAEAARVFCLTDAEKEHLAASTAARIIAALPFAAGCNDPERTAIAHITLYLAELRGFQKYCAHLPSDDSHLFSRLRPISYFDGGDGAVIDHGMTMLALIMLEGYRRSAQKDAAGGVYNPLAEGSWDYRGIKNSLLNRLSLAENALLDDIFYSPAPSDIW